MRAEIKYLVLDVDGTLTDGKIYMGNRGEIFKAFDIKDGAGIHDLLPKYGIVPVVLTGRHSKIVEERCRDLEIKYVYQGIKDKKTKLLEIAQKVGIPFQQEGKLLGIAYMGDDLPDIECLQLAELSGCPYNAVNEIKKCVDFVSVYSGGEGAVRDFIEWIIE